MFPLIKPLCPSFFCWLFKCVSSPSNQTPPPFSSTFLFFINGLCKFVCTPPIRPLVDYSYVICTNVCALPLIKPLPFSIYKFLFFYLIICIQSMWMYVHPLSNPSFFSLWFFFFLMNYLHTSVCTFSPIKPLLPLFVNFFFLGQLLGCECTLPYYTPPFLSLNFWQFTRIYVCSPLSNHSFAFSTNFFLSFIIYSPKVCVFPLSNTSFSFVNYSCMNVCALPLSNYKFLSLVEYSCECVCYLGWLYVQVCSLGQFFVRMCAHSPY